MLNTVYIKLMYFANSIKNFGCQMSKKINYIYCIYYQFSLKKYYNAIE